MGHRNGVDVAEKLILGIPAKADGGDPFDHGGRWQRVGRGKVACRLGTQPGLLPEAGRQDPRRPFHPEDPGDSRNPREKSGPRPQEVEPVRVAPRRQRVQQRMARDGAHAPQGGRPDGTAPILPFRHGHVEEPGIPREELVAPRPGNGHRHACAGRQRNEVGVEPVHGGLVDRGGKVRDAVPDVPSAHENPGVHRPQVVRDPRGVIRLVQMGPVRLEAHGEGPYPVPSGTGHESHQERGVHPAAQKRTDGHVAHQLEANALLEGRPDRVHELRIRHRSQLRPSSRAQGPISVHPLAPPIDDHPVARRQHPHILHRGPGLGDGSVRQQQAQGFRVERPGHEAAGQYRLHLGGEEQGPPRMRVQQRLDPDGIAGQEQPFPSPPLSPVVDRQGEHPADPEQEIVPVPLIHPEDDLGVGGRGEDVPLPLQDRPFLPEVVRLAVVDDPDRPVPVPHRLSRQGRKVDHGKPGHPQRDAVVPEDPGIVGTPVAHRFHHRLQRMPGNRTE